MPTNANAHEPLPASAAPNDPLARLTQKQIWHDCLWLSEHPDDSSAGKLMLLCIGRFFDDNAQSSSIDQDRHGRIDVF